MYNQFALSLHVLCLKGSTNQKRELEGFGAVRKRHWGKPRDRRNLEGGTQKGVELGLTCEMDQSESRGEGAREKHDEAARKV
jgi:hypothetical protein